MPPRFLNYPSLGIDFIFSLVVLVSCALIYFRTKELYDLTAHKGIKYFRNTFLFFGIAFAIRFIFHLILSAGINPILFRPLTWGILEFAFFAMAYASTMALIYLIYSIFWKKIDKYFKDRVYLLHIIALAIAFLSITSEPILFLAFQAALYILLIIISIINYRKTKSKIYLVYLLIFALWIINSILEFVIFITPLFGLILYGVSIVLFLEVLIKVLRELNSK